jgi:hypothetical protein
MNPKIQQALEAAIPIIITSLAVYWPQWTASMQKRGGWWAVGGTALVVLGNVVYKLFIGCVVFLALAAAVRPACAAPPALGITVPAKIVRTHDGDTATDVVIELHIQVRYLNCWARELTEPGGKQAAASAKQAEGKHGRLFIPLNDPVELWKLVTFGRVLGEFWPDGATESESQRQVRLGYAGETKKLEPRK